MPDQLFVARSELPCPASEAFAWHERPGAFLRLAPPWESVELESHTGIRDGGRAVLRMKLGPLTQKWIAEHRDYQPGRQFQDVQIEGPFAAWEHTHTILPETDSTCVLEDSIRYRPPLGALGRWFGGGLVRRKLERVFRYRHRITHDDLRAHAAARECARMNVLISGATGLVGSELIPLLETGGHTVTKLVRKPSKTGGREVVWDPARGDINAAQLAGIDAVVHLAGEGIANKRWSTAQKEKIRSSRTLGTGTLAKAVASMPVRPQVFVCASAIGFYGDRGDEVLDETSPAGRGFLPEVCREWEAACQPARDRGIRTVNMRIGVVLTPKGGALQKMLLPFKLGGGGVMGSGKQYWSWIALDDLIGAIYHALTRESVVGPVNATTPSPVTNREFTKTLGHVLHRPTIFPMPAFAARLALGEMADDLLLASARVVPRVLERTNYEFRFPQLEGAFRHLLGREEKSKQSPVQMGHSG